MTNNNTRLRMSPDDRQNHIIQVASWHFIRNGYDDASMSAIASEAGVTRPLLYHYFPGKSALFAAVLKCESEVLIKATGPDSQRSAVENLHAALVSYLNYFSSQSGRLLNDSLNEAGASLLINEQIKANHAIQIQRVISLLALEDTLFARGVINAWLKFVAALAREAADSAALPQDAIIMVCLQTLEAATEKLKRG